MPNVRTKMTMETHVDDVAFVTTTIEWHNQSLPGFQSLQHAVADALLGLGDAKLEADRGGSAKPSRR